MLKRVAFLYITSLFVSCTYSAKDLSITDYEKRFLLPYKKEDTIHFENAKKEVFSIVISAKDSTQNKQEGLVLPAFTRLCIRIKYLADTIKQKNTDTLYDDLVSVIKYPGSKTINYSFTFKEFFGNESNISELHCDTIKIINQMLHNYYVIKKGYPARDTVSTDIEEVYWTQNDGLVAYKYVNGEYWIKKGKRLY